MVAEVERIEWQGRDPGQWEWVEQERERIERLGMNSQAGAAATAVG